MLVPSPESESEVYFLDRFPYKFQISQIGGKKKEEGGLSVKNENYSSQNGPVGNPSTSFGKPVTSEDQEK